MTFFPKINDPSRGDPSLTVAEAIIESIRQGHHHHIAARWAGIWPETLSRWRTRGANELKRIATENLDNPAETELPYVNLLLDIDFAEADGQIRAVDGWKARLRDARDHRDYVRARYKAEWGEDPKRFELSGPEGGPVPIAAQVMDLDAAEALVARIEARVAGELAEASPEALGA